uniref:Uncharacterized protein n=1 Tax=Romanomermis culicivorax TaxID=13658 RepID=A0A915KG18_ROMCU
QFWRLTNTIHEIAPVISKEYNALAVKHQSTVKCKTTDNDDTTVSATKIAEEDDSATKIVKEEKFVDATKIIKEEVIDATKIVKEVIDATKFARELGDASEDKKKQSAFKQGLLTSSSWTASTILTTIQRRIPVHWMPKPN